MPHDTAELLDLLTKAEIIIDRLSEALAGGEPLAAEEAGILAMIRLKIAGVTGSN